ncbi:aspartate aminotransferase family protein [soil metagenome]
MSNALMPLYNRLPIALDHGKGVWLGDTEGKRYLDAASGIGVNALGHAHPALLTTITAQAAKLIHCSNVYTIPAQQHLAEDLVRLATMEEAYFCNSGAEANETAIKLARLYGHKQGYTNPAIVVTENSFHGRTLATLSASGNRKIQAGFEPLVSGFIRAPYNDLNTLEAIAKHSKEIVAILIEPILGNAGIILPDTNYLDGIRKLCDKYNWLMMLDEIQTGIGRTGKFYSYQHTTILPDVVTSAKALANGIPIAACLTRDKANKVLVGEKHGSTFGGSPFACEVARTVLRTIEQESLMDNAAKQGDYLMAQLREKLSSQVGVVAIRGKGLMIGIELDRPARPLLFNALEQGLLLNITAEKVIRLLPPLIITREEIDELVERLGRCLKAFYAS